MTFSTIAFAVFAGNFLTVLALWGLRELNMKGTDAGWHAFAAFLVPLFIVIGTIIVDDPPPYLDALTAQRTP